MSISAPLVRITTQMEAVARAPLRLLRAEAARIDLAGIGAWLLPAVLIVYLALNNGGYDAIERSEVGIAIWWLVMVGTAVGALPAAGGTRVGRAMFALLAAFAGWTALSLSWTESAERTAVELARAATYLGVFALALAVQGQGRWRQLLHGAAAGVAVVAGIAVLSRLEPNLFPERITGRYLAGIQVERQLGYPLNYSTGLAGFAAMGLPLLLGAAASARTAIGSALAGAALPILTLALWLTSSSLALPAGAVAVVAFLALAPDRLPKLVSLLPAGGGAAVLVASVEQRDALDRGLPTPAAQQQGDEVLAIAIVVCAGVALIQVGISLASRYGERPAWLVVPPRRAALAALSALTCVVIGGIAVDAPDELSERWQSFKTGGSERDPDTQVLDPAASGRYEYWESAVDANATDPWVGVGPGTFEFWWGREEPAGGFVRDAHSLFLETLAELGVVGLVLIGGFAAGVLGIGTLRSLRAPPERRLALAAATAGCAAFTVVAAVDWAWELAALPVVYLLLAAIAVAAGAPELRPGDRRPARPRDPLTLLRRYGGRGALVALGVAALVAISIPLAGALALERSRSDARDGSLPAALGEARTATRVQPYAATSRIQEALLYEQMGDLDEAASAATQATEREATNWRPWLILSLLEARRGRPEAALDAYRRAQSLNPHYLSAP
jgi:hypothetical protein